MADIMTRPADVTDSHGWLIRRYDEGHNDAVCPQCYSTLDLGQQHVCPKGCSLEVCRDFLCPYCLYGSDPYCEDK